MSDTQTHQIRVPPARNTEVPGERITITLDIAKDSLPVLLEGQAADRVQLVDNGDGTYNLIGQVTVGTIRAEGIVPYSDKLKAEMDTFADVLYEHGSPQVIQAWEAAIDRLKSWKGDRR